MAAGLNDLAAIEGAFDSSGALPPAARAHRAYYRPNYGWFPWLSSDDDQEVLDEALILAATNGHVEAAQALVAKGADIDGRAYATTPLLRATFRNRVEVIDWLLDEGADPNATGWLGGHAKGVTAFHLAASDGLIDVIRKAPQRGCQGQRGGTTCITALLRATRVTVAGDRDACGNLCQARNVRCPQLLRLVRMVYARDVYTTTKSDLVIRTQIYLTDRQRDQLAAMARTAGRRQSELIREAVDRFIERHGRDRRQAALRDAAGIWEDRTDLPPLRVLRGTWDRD